MWCEKSSFTYMPVLILTYVELIPYGPLAMMCRIAAALMAISVFFSGSVRADCFNRAGDYYRIDPDYLRAIAFRESGFNNSAVNHNRDKTGKILSSDHCVMQINTNTLNRFKREYPLLSIKQLKDNPCLCIHVGALVLRRNFNQYGLSWLAVGMYNAGVKNRQETISNRYNYAMKIDRIYKDIKSGKLKPPAIN